ncbi:MAG: DUF4976 domain-containing protein [Lentisphaerae bacterium]|nr:DUF4976 domain-containing protein [Lentisphaerota bacterium]
MTTRKPNVVLVITDQQRFDTIRAAGGTTVHTPHLDWLAEGGTRFTHAYCTSPMCSPARASILSGRLPSSHGMVTNQNAGPGANRFQLSEDVKVLADYLGPAGYHTAYIGKWHLGTGSDRRGFRDHVIRYSESEGDTSRPEDNDYARYAEKQGIDVAGKRNGCHPDRELYDTWTICGPSQVPLAHFVSTYLCSEAETYIRSRVGAESPFLLTWSCIQPHAPFVCPEPFFSMYDPADMVLPENYRDESGQRWLQRADRQLQSVLQFSETELKTMWARYLGSVSYIDHLMGRMLGVLNDTGQLDNTLFIFTSDHGDLMGSHSLILKGASLYEELIRVPLIIRPPAGMRAQGIVPRSAGLVSQIDLVPTILAICGLPPAQEVQGVDLSPLMTGATDSVRDAVQAEFHSTSWTDLMSPLRMWMTRDWKYVESREGDHELYHLAADPLETHNLAEDPQYAGQQAKLAEALHDWCRRSGDAWPEVPTPAPEVMKPAGPRHHYSWFHRSNK